MSRWFIRATSFAIVVAGLGQVAVQAQQNGPYFQAPMEAKPIFKHAVAETSTIPQMASAGSDSTSNVVAGYGAPQQAGYVRLNAPMYPTPKPNIPIWTGGTMITNQAFAPHEMLYPHTYRAMYPPFYHRVHGGYVWTPFGMRSHEKWELMGTKVTVKYRSHGNILKPQFRHATSYWGGVWK